jgi:antirestriction protein ArdC
MPREKLTADTARVFGHVSQAHIALIAQAAAERGCTCKAYEDWFTYPRWRAQGYQVRKGEHGVPLITFGEFEDEEEEITDDQAHGRKRRPWHTRVFCRCQVDPAEEAA